MLRCWMSVGSLVFAGALARAQSTLYTLSDTGEFGRAIAAIGDVNGDGRTDFAVSGAFNGNDPLVTLRSGLDGHVLRSWTDPFVVSVQFPPDVAGPGDVDGDGVPDVLVGVPTNWAFGFNAGQAFVYSGATGAQVLAIPGTAVNGRCGRQVFAVGDQDGDGHAEIGVYDNGSYGIYSGATGALRYAIPVATDISSLRQNVMGIGDVNGDSVPDIACGFPFANNLPGHVDIYSGVNGSLLRTIPGVHVEDLFGWKLADAGDIDHDGVRDLLVSAPNPNFHPLGGPPIGNIYVVSPVSGATLMTVPALTGNDHLGYGLAGGADLDGDGTPDIVAATADSATSLPWFFFVTCYSGANGALIACFPFTTTPSNSSHIATAVLGDIDGDGKAEFCLGTVPQVKVLRGSAPYGSPGSVTCAGDGTVSPCPCGNLGSSGAGCANLTGVGGRLVAYGSASLAANQLAFQAEALPPSTTALLFAGTPASAVFLGDGLRCAGAPVRLGAGVPQLSGARAWSLHPQSINGLVAGATRTFQAVYRNSPSTVCFTGANVTSGITITFTP